MGVADHLRPEGRETVTLDPGWHFLPALSAVRVYALTPESVQLNGAAAVEELAALSALVAEDLRPRFAEHGLGLLEVRIELEP
jgi:hypothetical protein